MLDVVVLGHCVCRSGNATLIECSQRLIFKGDGIRHARSQLISLIIEVVEVTMLLGNAIAIVKIALLAAVAPRIVNTLHIHVHFRLIAVLVPHALSLAVGRESLLDDVAVRVVVGIILRRHMVIE